MLPVCSKCGKSGLYQNWPIIGGTRSGSMIAGGALLCPACATDKIDRLTAILAPFAEVAKGIPTNWPAHCALSIDSGPDTDGAPYEWLVFNPPNVEGRRDAILPTIGQWRAAAQAAEGVSDA